MIMTANCIRKFQAAPAPTKRFLQKIGGAVEGTLTREAGDCEVDR